MPRFVRFGQGVVSELGDHLARFAISRVLLVTDPGIVAAGLAGMVADLCSAIRIPVKVYTDVEPQPSIATVQRLVDRVREQMPTAILAVGGGSIVDAGKIAALLASNPGSVAELVGWFGGGFEPERPMFAPIPLYTVPTTLCGADVVAAAAVSDPAAQTKFACWSLWLMPMATFHDPALTVSLPREILVDAALDSFTHALEGLTSVTTTPIVQNLSLDAAGRIFRSLPVVAESPLDVGARNDLCLGCLEAGLVIGNTRAAAIHGLSYPVSSSFPISHGRANALLAPAVVRFNSAAVGRDYAALSAAIGLEPTDEPGEAVAAAITALNQRLGLPTSLADVGVDDGSIASLTSAAECNRWFFDNNPRHVSGPDIELLYRASLQPAGLATRGRVPCA